MSYGVFYEGKSFSKKRIQAKGIKLCVVEGAFMSSIKGILIENRGRKGPQKRGKCVVARKAMIEKEKNALT